MKPPAGYLITTEDPESKFVPFPKIKRLFRDIVITEKIDGTNASIKITEDGQMLAGSRNKWLTLESDNHGFARWVEDNQEELYKLGPGTHFGEWWGKGIQRGYGQVRKRFSLFNTSKWFKDGPDGATVPDCCDVVPVLYTGLMDTQTIREVLSNLKREGSRAAPGFLDIEGVMVYHIHSGTYFKYTVDDNHKEA